MKTPLSLHAPRYPGPSSAEMLDEIARYVIATPYPFAVDLEASEGMFLATVDGQRLFDWAGYFGSKLIGHNHPRLYEADYVRRLVVAANNKVANPDFLTPQCLDYYRLLYRLAPRAMQSSTLEVYAVNSGAEAVENMMKYLVAKFNAKKRARGGSITGRRFLYFDQAFHGRSVYTLGVTQTHDPIATRDFHGLTTSGNIKLPFPALNTGQSAAWNRQHLDDALQHVRSVLTQMSDEVVAIIVEPIQGAGGQRVASPQFFEELSRLAREFDVYLAFDEVQTGLGPTGKVFAIDHFNLAEPPMAVAVGKKFGCGAVYMREPLEDVGVLDSTWGGTLADMVRVVQEVQIVEDEGLIQAASSKGEQLRSGLDELVARYGNLASNVRGMGLYQGFTLRSPQTKARFIEIARETFDLLLLGAGAASIRTRPNLSVSQSEIAHFLELLKGCFEELRREDDVPIEYPQEVANEPVEVG
ncbi:MAG: aminotransferase class III-fold pyridoxal phosphate-dependent enzyme [Armatimonadetes bacterium]|nr:aminotransferase class III-fold pyridoxal phosphate-dependent enzyme [Armatimonadota bacterium]